MGNIGRHILDKDFSSIYGDAEWMWAWQQKKFLASKNTGFRVAPKTRLSLQDSYKGVLIVAPPGSGKSTSFIIPNILELWKASAIITDPSGEIFLSTNGNCSRTHQIQVINFQNIEKSLHFNPLKFAHTTEDLHVIAEIIANHSNPKESDRFWSAGASEIIHLVLLALRHSANEGNERMNTLYQLRKVLEKIAPLEQQHEDIRQFMGKNLTSEQYATYKSWISKDEKIVLGHLASALASLDLWKESSYDVAKLTSWNTLDLSQIRKTPTVVYIISSASSIKRLSLVYKLFYYQCFRWFAEGYNSSQNIPLYFFLDEFGNIGRIPYLSSYINTVRKYRISFVIVLQSLQQLESNYGKEYASTILEGINTKIYLSGIHDIATLRYVEALLWTKTTLDVTKGYEERKAIAEPLLRASNVRMIGTNEAIMISGNKRPIRMKVQPYYQNKRLLRLSRSPPQTTQSRDSP